MTVVLFEGTYWNAEWVARRSVQIFVKEMDKLNIFFTDQKDLYRRRELFHKIHGLCDDANKQDKDLNP